MGNSSLCPREKVITPVHPHACGELESDNLCHNDIFGSSPRLWGTPVLRGIHLCPHRFIPTPVGNSRWCGPEASDSTVHPHACGELHNPSFNIRIYRGSSPRLWGTQTNPKWYFRFGRFIPTPVGNSTYDPTANPAQPVHPHACGEL